MCGGGGRSLCLSPSLLLPRAGLTGPLPQIPAVTLTQQRNGHCPAWSRGARRAGLAKYLGRQKCSGKHPGQSAFPLVLACLCPPRRWEKPRPRPLSRRASNLSPEWLLHSQSRWRPDEPAHTEAGPARDPGQVPRAEPVPAPSPSPALVQAGPEPSSPFPGLQGRELGPQGPGLVRAVTDARADGEPDGWSPGVQGPTELAAAVAGDTQASPWLGKLEVSHRACPARGESRSPSIWHFIPSPPRVSSMERSSSNQPPQLLVGHQSPLPFPTALPCPAPDLLLQSSSPGLRYRPPPHRP